LRSELMGQEKVGCNNKLIVLCIEIASQQFHYRRRRDVDGDNFYSPVPPEEEDLSLEQYTQLIEDLDKESSS